MYRDEREVLRDEVFALRREVEQARSDQDRLVVVEKELEAARRRLASFEKPRSQTNAVPLIAGLAVGMLVLGGVFVAVLMRSPAPRPPPVATVTPPTVVAPIAPVPTVAPVEPPTVVKPPRAIVHARWQARVSAVKGIALAIGSPCTIEGDVAGGEGEEGMSVDAVVVTCGKQVVYDEHGDLEGMSSNSSGSAQHAGEKKGTWTYDLVFSDVGTRGPSRNQVMLDSTKKLGKVWSENLPEMRVDLALQPHSDPTETAISGVEP